MNLIGTNYRELSQRILPALLRDLGDRRPLTFDAGDADVECSIRVKDVSRWIFCLNWEQHPVGVELGLRLDQGNYRLSTMGLGTGGEASLKGKSNLTASDLERFRVVLAPSEAKILMVQPVNKNPIGRVSTSN